MVAADQDKEEAASEEEAAEEEEKEIEVQEVEVHEEDAGSCCSFLSCCFSEPAVAATISN